MNPQGTSLDWLPARLAAHGDRAALINDAGTVTYSALLEMVDKWRTILDEHDLKEGESVAVVGDYCPNIVALLLAIIDRKTITVPLTTRSYELYPQSLDVAGVTRVFRVGLGDYEHIERPEGHSDHPFLQELRDNGEAGLILFTSGSTGNRKAALLSFNRLLERMQTPRPAHRTLVFLMFDHIGGLNTLFHTLCNGGTVVTAGEPTVKAVCDTVEKYKIELLPTTPSFLNMLLLSGEHLKHDLSSLQLVTYGTEPMPESSLRTLAATFPDIRLKQTYGLSEVGIMQTKSKANDSLWVKVGGDGVETRIVDGILHVKAPSAMVGYLNAPSPFDEDGWFNTQDEVEVDGDYLKIKGRTSEIINVGGEKVYPAEVESVLMEIPNVRDVLVYGKKNPVLGTVVAAKVSLTEPEPTADAVQRIRAYCQEHLLAFQVPVLITVTDQVIVSDRFKKARVGAAVNS